MIKLLVAVLTLSTVAAFSADYPVETQEVKTAMTNLVVDKSFRYCQPNTLTCRNMVLLKDKKTNKPTTDIMYDNFMSSERFVTSTAYAIKNTDGTYHLMTDKIYDGQIVIDYIDASNSNVKITFDKDGLPTFHDLVLKTLGTTKKKLATMTYSQTQSTIVGFEYDDADPNYKVAVNNVYPRIQ